MRRLRQWFHSRRERAARIKYREAMMEAIRTAAKDSALFKPSSLSFGLRVIRRFEETNGCKFDPMNSLHVRMVSGWGFMEHMNWKMRKVLSK